MSDGELSLAFGVAAILVNVAFFFAVFRRIWWPADGISPVSVVLMLLFFKISIPVAFIFGWIRCSRYRLTPLMTYWTLSILSTALLFQTSGFVWCCSLALLLASFWFGLISHLRTDRALRALVRNPSEVAIDRVAGMGESIAPELERLLEVEYQPARLAVVECAARIGPPGQGVVAAAAHDADSTVAAYAQERLLTPA